VNSLALEYFSRASDYGDTTGSLVSCVTSASSQRGTLQTPYCARGDLGGTAPTPCTAASGLTCGPHADDLALAMAGRAPQDVWITRLVGRIAPADPSPDALVSSPGGSPIHVLRVAGATCKSSGGGSSGGGGSAGAPNNSGGCSGSVEDTSSSSGDVTASSDDSCSSDSTDSSSSGDDCGSSDSGGDSCDSGGGGGGDCGGGGGGGDCADATPRKNKTAGKSPLSRLTLSAALVLLPLRRLTRRKKLKVQG
jgi:hypothetical protein